MNLKEESKKDSFDFDAEFAKGLTVEEAKSESIRRIREWWGKDKIAKPGIDRETFDFDKEFKKGLTPKEFKDEMAKRIKMYPWK